MRLYLTDNGSAGAQVFNAGMRGAKGTPWLGGTRVPLFAHWPSRIRPADCERLAAHVDLFATLTDIARVPVPGAVRAGWEGRSLAPLLADPTADWPQRTLFSHLGRWPRCANFDEYKFIQCTVRRGRHHLVSVSPPHRPAAWQLFDLETDPAESRDIAAARPGLVAELAGAHDEWWRSVRSCMCNEDVPLATANPYKVWFHEQFGPSASAEPGHPLPSVWDGDASHPLGGA